jgi:hypothetical protein
MTGVLDIAEREFQLISDTPGARGITLSLRKGEAVRCRQYCLERYRDKVDRVSVSVDTGISCD